MAGVSHRPTSASNGLPTSHSPYCVHTCRPPAAPPMRRRAAPPTHYTCMGSTRTVCVTDALNQLAAHRFIRSSFKATAAISCSQNLTFLQLLTAS